MTNEEPQPFDWSSFLVLLEVHDLARGMAAEFYAHPFHPDAQRQLLELLLSRELARGTGLHAAMKDGDAKGA